MKKLIITAALLGAGTTREQTPYVPISPEEIASDVVAVTKAGASIVHLHIRDEDGNNSSDLDRWVEVVEMSKEACRKENLDVVFNLTSSGSKFPNEERLAHLKEIRPEMCSLTPNTMNWANAYVFKNEPSFIEDLGRLAIEYNIKPEIEIFDYSMIESAKYYIKKGLIKTPCHFQFVLGVSIPGRMSNLAHLIRELPEGSTWSATGIGRYHLEMMLSALASNCDVLRVGLEDNIKLSKNVYAKNVDLVERAVKLGEMIGREIATAEEAREILGLENKW